VGDGSEFTFSTAQGDFSFRASEVPYGKGIYKLGGRVYVDRVPATTRLTDTPEEEDYPALAAGSKGTSGWHTCNSITVPMLTKSARIHLRHPKTSNFTRSPQEATKFGRGDTRVENGAKTLP
jgi:hypothetical protein